MTFDIFDGTDKTFKQSEVLNLLKFFSMNFKSRQSLETSSEIKQLYRQFNDMENLLREQSYNLIIFLDMFKEMDKCRF